MAIWPRTDGDPAEPAPTGMVGAKIYGDGEGMVLKNQNPFGDGAGMVFDSPPYHTRPRSPIPENT